MAKFKCKLAKKGMMAATPAKAGAKATGDLFTITDLGGGTLTVTGHDAAGAGGIDLSGVATLTVVSSDVSVLTIDPPSGMTATCHGVKPGQVTLTVTATWNDGSMGPFTIDVTASVTQGPATGLDVTFTDATPT
jgi:hypothetical protein